MHKSYIILLWSVSILLFAMGGCKPDPACEDDCPDDPGFSSQPYEFDLPDHFPAPFIPADNEPTEEKVALGKMLFYDVNLSRDSTISCGNCHDPSLSFTDGRTLSLGVDGRTGSAPQERRNGMALFNLMWHPNLFWDGRIANSDFDVYDALEKQALEPIVAFHEMDNTMEEVIRRLNLDPFYPGMFEEAFNDTITAENVAKAIASFERTLVSYNSKYDQFIAAGRDSSIFTELELRGLVLFFGETGNVRHPECFHCHGGFNFDDPSGRLRDNGLEITEDAGAFMVDGRFENFGLFKVPSLRNLSYTAPYMHDGRFATLEEVLDHYDGGSNNNMNTDPLISLIEVKREDREAIIAFLRTLDDESFITNPAFQP